MRQFCFRHRYFFFTLSLACALFAVCMVMSGCNTPAWLTDAEQLIPILGATITSVLSFIAGLTGNPALSAVLGTISTIITDVGNGLAELETLINQYKSSPNETTLQKIEDIANLISSNLNQILQATGLPDAIASKIQAWASLVLSQLEAWLAILPALKTAALTGKVSAKPLNDQIMSASALKSAANEIWATKTGDPAVDAALANVVPVV